MVMCVKLPLLVRERGIFLSAGCSCQETSVVTARKCNNITLHFELKVIMAKNLGATTLKSRKRSGNPMRDYDNLPPELRRWLSEAALPWRPKSVQQAYQKAVARTGNPQSAIAELNRLQEVLISKDASRIWGRDHPAANSRIAQPSNAS